jgi:hypothetical protein
MAQRTKSFENMALLNCFYVVKEITLYLSCHTQHSQSFMGGLSRTRFERTFIMDDFCLSRLSSGAFSLSKKRNKKEKACLLQDL